MNSIRSFLLLAVLACAPFVPLLITAPAQTLPADPVLTASAPALPAHVVIATTPAPDLTPTASATSAEPTKPAEAPSVIADLAVKYPIITTVLMVMGLLRLILKPIVEWLRARAAATADPADDERLAQAERSWWFKALLFALDWGASIKPVK